VVFKVEKGKNPKEKKRGGGGNFENDQGTKTYGVRRERPNVYNTDRQVAARGNHGGGEIKKENGISLP